MNKKNYVYAVWVLFLLTGVVCLAQECSKLRRPKTSGPESPSIIRQPNPIEHIVVIMQENHSFDRYLGRLNQEQFYGKEVDGVKDTMYSLDEKGNKVYAYHENNLCVLDPDHGWNAGHKEWNFGKNDGFIVYSGRKAMGYYDQNELPYYYALANTFATADRYFSSVPGPTFPNRFYLYAGTSFGHIDNIQPTLPSDYSQKTIFDMLNDNNISWKYYSVEQGYLKLFQPMYRRNLTKMGFISDYLRDAKNGTLPQVSFVESGYDMDEHPEANVQIGQNWVAQMINALMASPNWKSSVLFLTYDENGGFYDHVSLQPACIPDNIPPKLERGDYLARFDLTGFRVPFIAVSPYVKHHFVSHVTYDHTSVLRFIENKYGLPALTARDANAEDLSDLFDFSKPVFDVPELPRAIIDPSRCHPSQSL